MSFGEIGVLMAPLKKDEPQFTSEQTISEIEVRKYSLKFASLLVKRKSRGARSKHSKRNFILSQRSFLRLKTLK